MKNPQWTDDTPPEYDAAVASSAGSVDGQAPSSAGSPMPVDQKRPLVAALSSITEDEPTSPVSPGSLFDLAPGLGFLDFWSKRQKDEEIKATLRGLIYDVMKNLSDSGSVDILQSCLAACRSNGLSFEDLIQEEIEGHTPLYWAILSVCHKSGRSLPPQGEPSRPELVLDLVAPAVTRGQPGEVGHIVLDFLLSFPLKDATVQDARNACMLNDANALLQHLRRFPMFEKTSYAESVMGVETGDERVGDVRIEHVSDAGVGTFKVAFVVPHWVKRVKLAKIISVQWIARGRAWKLSFGISAGQSGLPSGTWYSSLTLLKDSLATPIDGILLLGPVVANKEADLPNPEAGRVILRFQKRKLEVHPGHEIKIKLGSVPGGATLEYEDSPYLSADGSLMVQGEFVLEKNDSRKRT